jgi:tryptophan synthase alpha chain
VSRIETALRLAVSQCRAGLVPFLVAGDPDPEETPGLIAELARAGADVVELGVPFSDPVADGPAIQRASERALARGTTLALVLDLVRRTRARTDVPIVLFGYLNPVLAFGPERFASEAASAGVDGLLLVDLPVEEGADLRAGIRAAGLDTIQLAAPTSGAERIRRIAAESRGFVYAISRTGVTGARAELAGGLGELVAAIREASTLPVAVGFGVSRPDQARAVAALADGVVVGSALVETIAAAPSAEARLAAVGAFTASIRAALGKPGRPAASGD